MHVASGKGTFKTHFSGDYIVQGVKINTPHYLSQMEVPPGNIHYNLIVSQLMEQMSLMYYTLKVYSTVPFHLEPVKEPYTHRKKVRTECVVLLRLIIIGVHCICYQGNRPMVRAHSRWLPHSPDLQEQPMLSAGSIPGGQW